MCQKLDWPFELLGRDVLRYFTGCLVFKICGHLVPLADPLQQQKIKELTKLSIEKLGLNVADM